MLDKTVSQLAMRIVHNSVKTGMYICIFLLNKLQFTVLVGSHEFE